MRAVSLIQWRSPMVPQLRPIPNFELVAMHSSPTVVTPQPQYQPSMSSSKPDFATSKNPNVRPSSLAHFAAAKPAFAQRPLKLMLKHGVLVLGLIATGGFTATSAFAQTTTPPAKIKSLDDVVELSPFLVSTEQDNGYQAGSSVAGSRLAVSLKETSAVIGFITRDFMDDIGAKDISELGNWAANSYFTGREDGEVNNINVRGIPGSFQSIARNYFVIYTPIFPYNVERIEIPRGPNAALYGDAPLGGMINSNSKRPLFQRNRAEATLRYDDAGSTYAAIDVNIPLGDRVAFRINGLEEKRKDWVNGGIQNNEGLHLTGAWLISKKTNTVLRAEIEFTRDQRTLPPGVVSFSDQISNWDRTTAYTAQRTTNFSSTTGTTGLSNTLDYWVFNSGDAGLGLTNWKGFGRSTGRGFAVIPEDQPQLITDNRPGLTNFPKTISREFSLQPKDTFFRDLRGKLMAAYLEHTFFDKLAVDVGFNYQVPDRYRTLGNFYTLAVDVNQVRPDGSPNPHYGEAYADLDYNQDRTRNWVEDARVLATYPIKWKFMDQRIVGLIGHRSDLFDNYRWGLRRVNGPSNLTQNTGNIVHIRRYLSDANIPLGMPGDYGSVDVEWEPYQRSKEIKRTDYKQLGLVGRYWDGKLSTNFGWRGDDFTHNVTSQPIGTSSVVLGNEPVIIWNSDDPVRNASPDPVQHYPRKFNVNSYTAGAVYFPVKWLGVFANYSSGFTVQGAGPHLFGGPWDPPKNEGLDLGLKIEFFDGKLSGSISHYDTKRSGVDQQVPSESTRFKQIWDIVRDGYLAEAAQATSVGNTTLASQLTSTAGQIDATNDLIYAGAYDTRTTNAKGWELDLVFNPTKNWRGTFNLAFPETSLSNAQTEQRAYYADNKAQWLARAANSALTDSAGINTRITAIEQDFLDNTDGRTTTGTPDYTARFFSTYSFNGHALNGLQLGGGIRVDGPRVIGTPRTYNSATKVFENPNPLATTKSAGYNIISLMASYSFKAWGETCKAQVNVDNLFDVDTIPFTGVTTYTYTDASGATQGAYVKNGYRYLSPRTISFSLNVKF